MSPRNWMVAGTLCAWHRVVNGRFVAAAALLALLLFAGGLSVHAQSASDVLPGSEAVAAMEASSSNGMVRRTASDAGGADRLVDAAPAVPGALDVAIVPGTDWTATTAVPPAFYWNGVAPVFSPDSFQFSGCGFIDVTDDFNVGDRFRIYDNGVPIGTTSDVPGGPGGEVGPEAAFNDPAYSSGTFIVGAGSHDITIEVIANAPGTAGGRGYIRVRPCADLSVSKGAEIEVIAGKALVYTIWLRNEGPGSASNVVVTDVLPTGFSYVDSSASCSVSGQSVVCQMGDMAAGAGQYLLLKAAVDPGLVRFDADGMAAAENVVSVTALPPNDPKSANNVSRFTTFVADQADLAVVKLSKPDKVVPAGQTFEYTIYVDNLGPSWARGVYIDDDMISSGAFTIVGVKNDPFRQDACSLVQAPAPQTGQLIRCALHEPLEPFGSAFGTGRWRIQVEVRANQEQDVNNTVRVYTGAASHPTGSWINGTPDPDTSNNLAVDNISVFNTANLRVTKDAEAYADGGLVVTAGEDVLYTLVVSNAGPSTAHNVTLVDVLSGALVDGSVDVFYAGCSVGSPGDATDPMVCQLGNLAPGDSIVIEMVGTVDPSFVATQPNTPFSNYIDNDAWVYSDTFDPDTYGNRANCFIEVNARADLGLTKQAVGSAVSGTAMHFEYYVSNHGPSTSEDVMLVDYLPAGMKYRDAFVTVKGVPGSVPVPCTVATGSNAVVCSLGNIVPTDGSPVVVIVNVMVDAAVLDGTELTNSAVVVSGATLDPDPQNSAAEVTVTASAVADLGISKKVIGGPPVAGGLLTWEIAVTNHGPSTALGVVVDDPLPSGVTFLSATHAGCDGTVRCELGDIAAGETVTFQLVVRVDVGVACDAGIRNVATVSSLTPEPSVGGQSNTASVTVVVLCSADLRVTKFVMPEGTVRAGETFTYTIFVDNLGPSVAHDVVLHDTLLSSGTVSVQSCAFSVSQGGGSITQFTCTTGSLVSTQFGTDIATFRTNSLDPFTPTTQGRLRASFRLVARDEIDVTNTVRVTSSTPDPDTSNNFATVPISVSAVANLSVSKISNVASVAAGGVSNWQVTVRNNGPSIARNVVVRDLLSAAIVDGSVEVLGLAAGACTMGTPGDPSNPLTCNLGNLGNGASRTFQILADVHPSFLANQPQTPASDFIDNNVWVTSDTFDSDTSNNLSTAFVTVTGSADLALRKFAVGVPVAGEGMHYELQLTNAGPSTAANVTLRDFLPREVEFVSAFLGANGGRDGRPLDCDVTVGSNALFCALGDIEPTSGTGVLIFVNVRIKPDATGSLLNTADVLLADTPDPDPSNNTASVTVNVRFNARVTLEKAAVASSLRTPDDSRAGTVVAVGGGTLTYRLTVRNDGPSTAYDVRVTDPLNADLVYRYSTSAVCVYSGGQVVCDLGDLQPGEVRTFYVVVGVREGGAAGGATHLENCATAAWTLGDGSQHSFGDCERVPVNYVADLRVRKFGKPDDEVRPGELLTYTIMVDNLGPSAAPEVTVVDELRATGYFDIMGLLPDATGLYGNSVHCSIDAPTSSAPINPIGTNLPVGVPYVPGAEPIAPGVNQRATITCVLGAPGSNGNHLLPVFGPPYNNNNNSAHGEGRLIIEIAVMARDGVNINNCVDVSSRALDPDFSNNSTCTAHEIIKVSDLAVTKRSAGMVGPLDCDGTLAEQDDRVTAGQTMRWTIDVTNHGPSVAENVTVIDRLPPGVRVTGTSVVDGDGVVVGNCQSGMPGSALDRLVCGLGDLATGTAVVRLIHIEAEVDPSLPDGTILENDVRVDSDIFDDNNANNHNASYTRVNTVADLTLAKSAQGPFPWKAGEVRTYVYDIANAGPSWARDVALIDFLPPQAQFVRAWMGVENRAGGVPLPCNITSGNLLECRLGDLPLTGPGGPTSPTVFVDVFLATDIADGTVITNSASVMSDTLDPCLANNMSALDITVLTEADVWLKKWVEPQKAFAGEQIRYHIRVGNNGPADALNVVVIDDLPPQVAYEVDTDSCTVVGVGPGGGQRLHCPLGTLKPGQVEEFYIWARIHPSVPSGTTIVNEACVESETTLGDPDLSNNCDQAKVLVLRKADLKVVKFGKPDTEVRAGQVLTYTVIVDNHGPSWASGVALKDVLQASKQFDLIDVTSDRPARCAALTEGQKQAWNLYIPGTTWLPPAVPPPWGVIAPTGIQAINQRLQLDCTLADDPATPNVDESDLAVLAADGPPNSGRWILTVRVRARDTQDINNIADVLSAEYDPYLANNHAEVKHAITNVADLQLTKTALGEVQLTGQTGFPFNAGVAGTPFPQAPNYGTSATHVTAGRRIQYTLVVRNHGPSTAENVVLTDRLPAGLFLYPGSVVITGGAGNCEIGTPGQPLDRMTCGLGNIVAGGSRTVVFQVVTSAHLHAGLPLDNDAFVYSDIFDPFNANNYAHTQTLVNAWADVAIAKTAVGEVKTSWDATLRRFVVQELANQVTAGHALRYEIAVWNNGPSDARNVTVRDVLPPTSQVKFLRAHGASCRPDELSQNILYCSVGRLRPGEKTTFDVYVLVDSAVTAGTVLNNLAQVLAGPNSPAFVPPLPSSLPVGPLTNDPYTSTAIANSTNSATNLTSVTAVADVYIDKVDEPEDLRLDRAYEPDLAMAGTEHRYRITFGNKGWSVARGVGIQDTLDYKQSGILGETFVRCEPFDFDDTVTCTAAGGVVTVNYFKSGNDVIIPAAGQGVLNPGEAFGFWLITMVDPGYVLDADQTGTTPNMLITNRANISTTTTDFHSADNVAHEHAVAVAEADLQLTKTDIFGDFLECDPVERGGTVTYHLTVENKGPSDAAEVFLVDWLPAAGVVLDPAQIEVSVVAGEAQVVEVRDDGRITVRIGHDRNNRNVQEWGRLNVGSSVTVRIRVTVAETAVCGAVLGNRAMVETRRNDAKWPPAAQPVPGVDGGPRTPTADPDPSNNSALETTTVECPEIFVRKTVSFDGTCPGRDLPAVWNQTAQPVTFCYEVINVGTTYLDSIYLEDKLTSRTRPVPTVIYTDTITFGADPLLPVAPGERVWRQVTLPHLLIDTLWDCGTVTDTVTVTANPVNSGRTDLACLSDVTASDTAVIKVPCAGVDWRLQLPVVGSRDCEGWIQVQNVGATDTKALLMYWGEPGFCPPQAAGPLKSECSGLLAPGSAWSFAQGQLPPGARSAMVYSLSTQRIEVQPGTFVSFADVVCNAAFYGVVGDWYDWLLFDTAYRQGGTWGGLDFGKHQGEPLAAVVNRSCPDPTDPNVTVNAAYTGISSDMEGARDPRFSGYTYYAPLVFADQGGLNSALLIHNSGDECTSLEIWFKDQENCLRSILGDVLTVAPGETVRFDPNTVVGPNWVGSAWIRGSQPLGIVIDTLGANHFTSYVGVTADVWSLDWSYGNQVSYLPLTYSEYQGWDTAIQVQNLSATYAAKVKVYFLDRSGGVITTLMDWICPRGSQTFFLPLIDNIPGNWVGSARVESQEWVTPGGPLVDPPRIHAVALMEKWADPQRTARREAVAYNGQSESLLFDWQLGAGKGGTASGSAVMAVPLIAKDYRRITTELAITNLVPKPGFTDFAVFLYDQNGLLDYFCQKLNEKQVEYIDLATWGAINPRFMGSAVISAMFWEHNVFDASGQFQRNLVGLGGVAVERIGGTLGGPDVPGDESKAFEAFPVYDHFKTSEAPHCPGVPRGFTGR